MFDEPSESPESRSVDPAQRAKDKSDEFRMHAELAAIFEGNRKFDARILPTLDAQIARDCQKTIAKLEKAKAEGTPVVAPEAWPQAAEVLDLPGSKEISTNDYHIYRRPGEVMIVRWLAGEEVETFYTRLQAHFDFALEAYREDQKQSHGWKQHPQTTAYLAALDAIEVKMEERYLRPIIREHGVFVLSTQAADEMDISHLCDYIMGVPAEEIVGTASAPPDDPTERDRAWFFKLFSLRGIKDGVEQMCFFAYMQKSDDSADW
jgi:hypothetical protein